MPFRPTFTTLAAIASLALACARSDADHTDSGRPAIPPGTAARAAAQQVAGLAADSQRAAARIAQCAEPGCASGSDTSGSAATTDDVEELPLPNPAYGALPVVPPVYTDSGPCPGEGCYKGLEWTVRSVAARLFTRPDTMSATITTLEPGTQATALSRLQQTVPQPFIVGRAASVDGRQGDHMVRGHHVPGDTLWVLTYLGEGHFRVRLPSGAVVDDYNLGFSPGGGSYGKRCESHPACWGALTGELRTTNWMKLRAPNGREGWTKTLASFVIPD